MLFSLSAHVRVSKIFLLGWISGIWKKPLLTSTVFLLRKLLIVWSNSFLFVCFYVLYCYYHVWMKQFFLKYLESKWKCYHREYNIIICTICKKKKKKIGLYGQYGQQFCYLAAQWIIHELNDLEQWNSLMQFLWVGNSAAAPLSGLVLNLSSRGC